MFPSSCVACNVLLLVPALWPQRGGICCLDFESTEPFFNDPVGALGIVGNLHVTSRRRRSPHKTTRLLWFWDIYIVLYRVLARRIVRRKATKTVLLGRDHYAK